MKILLKFCAAGIVGLLLLGAFVLTSSGKNWFNPIDPLGKESIEQAVVHLKTQALNGKLVNWDTPLRQALAKAGPEFRRAEVTAAISHLVSLLNENHSSYLNPKSAAALEKEPTTMIGLDSGPWPFATQFVDGVPLIRVDGFISMNDKAVMKAARELQNAIAIGLKQNPCGFILDLSGPQGGNMYPNLIGLYPFLTQSYFEWEDRDTNRTKVPFLESWKMSQLDSIINPKSTKIAVLIGPKTASAGEFVTIALKHNPNVFTVGQETADFTTANVPLPLPNKGILVLSVAHMVDYQSKAHRGPVVPDFEATAEQAPSRASQLIQKQCAKP
jgi:carboxyl-terminal processing protease